MKIISEFLRAKLVRYLFRSYYQNYTHEWKNINQYLEELNKEQRQHYYEAAYRFSKSECFKQEIQELIRAFMKELAFKSVKEIEFNAIRMTLVFIKDFEQRLKILAQRYESNLEEESNKKAGLKNNVIDKI